MKSTKRLAIFTLCAVLLISFAGCAVQQPAPAQTGEPAAPALAQTLRLPALQEAKPLSAPSYDTAEQSPAAGYGANEFSFALAAALLKKGENMIVSPFSVWMTLAALANATGTDALPALLQSLGVEDLTVQEINDSVSRMLYELTGNEGADTHNPLAIANAVFVDNEVTLKKAFAQSFLDYYRGAAMNVDFKDPAAIDAINGWASEHTGGLIKDIVKEIPDETVVALANAIYFSDRWAWEFDEEETEEMTFHGAKNDVTAPFMLREGNALSYYEDNALQGINLNFKTGGGLYILLPRDGDADALLQGMTAERFAEIVKDTRPATGKLLLPRFELLSDFKLNDALKQLGVPLLDPDTAPVSGLVEETDTYIAASLHQAMISVDEKGTTAAAVTVEMMAGTSLPMPTEPFSMVCDRPFVFVLHRWTADAGEQVLFTGVVNQL